jgi:protein transport protein SEC24
MVATAARTILESLDRLPNTDDRAKVSIIAYDSSLHFFALYVGSFSSRLSPRLGISDMDPRQPGSTEPSMLVVSDLDEVFLPKPSDLLVNLTEARTALESLLGRLNDMFKDNQRVNGALGAALQAAYKLIVRV